MSKPKLLSVIDKNANGETFGKLNNIVTVTYESVGGGRLRVPNDVSINTTMLVTFKSPCDSNTVTNVAVGDKLYQLVDANGTSISGCSLIFSSDCYVTVLLDVDSNRAYIQNSANNPTINNLLNQKTNGIPPIIHVTTTVGSTITCTNGEDTLTATSTESVTDFSLPSYGTWTLSATLGDKTSSTEIVTVDTVKEYYVTLTYFSATLKVTAKSGSTVTVSKGSKVLTDTANTSDLATFTVTEAGTYTVYANYDGCNSNTASVNVSNSGSTYTVSVTFITLVVTVDSGSSVTVSSGSVSKQAISTGTVTFYLPSTGTWTVTAALSSATASDTVTISSYTNYTLTLNYYKYYGVKIQIGNSNPSSGVTYIGDAVGMSAGTSWDNTSIFKNIKPCLVKNGVVQYYLNPSNLAQKTDGSTATINSTESGDVMIEIPKLGYKMTTDDSYHYVYVTDDPAAEGYCYRAHSLDSEGDCDKIYIGAYLGYVSSNRLYSLSNQSPTKNTTLTNFRTYASARGTGYQLMSFYPLTLLQCLYLIKYKNRDGQSAIGKGYVNTSSEGSTGSLNAAGIDYGTTSSIAHMCFLNIEDFWGNLYYWIDGLYYDNSRNIKTAYKSFNDTGAGYPYTKSSGISNNIGNYLSDIQGTNEGGFIAKVVNGSSTTYYADYAFLYAGCCAIFGGNWANGDYAGPFFLCVDYAASGYSSYLGARLMYKHKA